MPSDVLYTHLNALICQQYNGGGGPITYQFILYYDGGNLAVIYDCSHDGDDDCGGNCDGDDDDSNSDHA